MNDMTDPPSPPPADVAAGLPGPARTRLGGYLQQLRGFARDNIRLLNLRLNQRYKPAADFPLKVTLYVAGGAWTTVIQNISGTGLGVRVDPHTPMSVGQSARVVLELDQHQLDIKARIAYMETREDGLFAGIELRFDNFPLQKSYLELLHPIVIGRSLKPASLHRVTGDEPGLITQLYEGESHFSVMVRREDTAGEPLHSVEFRIDRYSWRITRPPDAPPGWVPPPARADEPKPEPIYDHSGGLQYEVHELFRWVAYNLSDAVPADVRSLVHPAGD